MEGRMITIWTKRAAAVLIVTVALVAGLVQDVRAQTTSVSIQNYTFTPETLTVAAGTTVQWTNLDSVAHTVTSDSNAFGSGVLAHQGQFTFKFTQPGTYTYHCQIHDYMTGSIVVTSAGGPATSTPTTVPTVTPPPATPTATATGVSSPPTATATAPAATSTTVPSATDPPVP